jgi:hypothetical protein
MGLDTFAYLRACLNWHNRESSKSSVDIQHVNGFYFNYVNIHELQLVLITSTQSYVTRICKGTEVGSQAGLIEITRSGGIDAK